MTLNLTKQQLQAHNHIASSSTAPARPQRYLAGGKGLLPHSCTLYVHRDVVDALSFTARSLKTGSGVKTVFDKSFTLAKPAVVAGKVHLRLQAGHPDCELFSPLASDLEPGQPYRHIVVQDSMETEDGLAGETGIICSWELVAEALSNGLDVIVDLSNLRPAGSTKSDGYNVTSSGPASFAEIYLALEKYLTDCTMLSLLQLLGTLNEVILKGGHKRGIVTSMMHSDCPAIEEYLNSPTALLDGSHKKGIIISHAVATSKKHKKLRQRICELVNTESIFLQKAAEDLGLEYADTYSNVCVGIMLPDRGTCLIWRVNLGLISTKQQLLDAFVLATRQCVSLHKVWHDEQSDLHRKLWQPLANDRQVAIDVLGLANMLSLHGVSYADFLAQLADCIDTEATELPNTLAGWFAEAYIQSTVVAQELAAELELPPFLRLHTVEPAQSHAFTLADSGDYTTCRGIWPPFAQVVNRVSDNEQTVTVDHGDVEVLADLTKQQLFDLNDLWQKLMVKYGLPHAISMDIYEYIDEAWLDRWYKSSLLTAYYQFAGFVDQSFSRKQVEDVAIGELEAEPVLDNSESDSFLSDFGKANSTGESDLEPGAVCPLDPTQRAECSVCSE